MFFELFCLSYFLSDCAHSVDHGHDGFLVVDYELRVELFFEGVFFIFDWEGFGDEWLDAVVLVLLFGGVDNSLEFLVIFEELVVDRGILGVALYKFLRVVGVGLWEPVVQGDMGWVDVGTFSDGEVVFWLRHKFISR